MRPVPRERREATDASMAAAREVRRPAWRGARVATAVAELRRRLDDDAVHELHCAEDDDAHIALQRELAVWRCTSFAMVRKRNQKPKLCA